MDLGTYAVLQPLPKLLRRATPPIIQHSIDQRHSLFGKFLVTALFSSYWTLFLFLAASGLSVEDRAIVRVMQRAEPGLKHVIVVKRFPASEQLNLVLATAEPRGGNEFSRDTFGWANTTRLGFFLQDRAEARRIYQLAIMPGVNDECLTRIERMIGRELVLSGAGEKGTICDNQKFVFDLRAKKLVVHFSYLPFRVSHVLQASQGPQFVMTDTQQLLLVERRDDDQQLRVVPKEQARSTLSRVRMEESSVGGRVYRTPVPPADVTPAFGPRKRFRLATEKNGDGWDSPLVVEKVGTKEKMYRLPQSDLKTWQLARKDEIANGIPADQPLISEEIGPHQLEGNRLWFGKTFYNGEGRTGVGGFGYFDATTRSYRLYSPAEIYRWSVSAIRVEPDFIWLGLYHFGEYGGDPGDLFLRWDRKTEEVRRFTVRSFISQISRHHNALYLSGFDGIDVLRGDEIQSYFIDRTVNGRYQIVERTVR